MKKIILSPALTSAPANADAFTIVKQNVYVEQQVAEHETSQATSRTRVEDIQTKTTDIQTKVTDIQSTVNTTYSLLQTVDGKIDVIDTNVDTLLTNLQTVDDNVDAIVAKWGALTAQDIIDDISGVKTVVDSIRSSQQLNYTVELSDIGEVLTGNTYRAKLTILNYESQPTDAVSAPSITLYDAVRATAATSTMTKLSTGVYEYTYSVLSSDTSGLWETVVSVDLGGALAITRQDCWEVEGSPAQVIINSISDLSAPSIAANVTISNEGVASYEYQYEWCVVSQEDNACGGGDDVFYSSAAKYILTGEDWNTSLSATVSNIGSYWFKVVVYYGTEASGASQTFIAVEEGEEATPSPGGGGGGGTAVSLTTVYNKLLEVQNELGFHGKTKTAYEDMRIVKSWVGALPGQLSQPMYKELSGISKSLDGIEGTSGVDFSSPAFQSLLDISKVNTADLQEIKNKLADLRAVSSVTRRLVEQTITEPLVETWMTFNSVQFNFLITNPLTETKTLKFKSYLPVEVKPEHIMDLSGLSIDYDSAAASYYVWGNIALGPGQSITKKVEIKDIWVFADEEIEFLKKQAETLVKPLEKTQYEAMGAVLKNENEATLNIILLNQKEGYRTPQDHIVAHRANVEKMAGAKRNLEKMKDLVVQAGASQGMVGKVGGIQTFATWGIILAIVFGFGLLAVVIFAMWRHQTILAMAAMSTDKKEILALLGKKKRLKKKPVKTGVLKSVALGAGARIRSGVSSMKIPFIWRLPWKKILIWIVVIGVVVVLGFLTIKFAPGLFSGRETTFEKEMPAIAPAEESTKSIIPETQENVEMVFSESSNPKLKILDTPTGWLNVRDTASLDGNIITKVYPNEQYEYTEEKNGWYYITIPKNKSGWVFGEYVQELKN
ncbi:MAG: SH3 domain-containing protein [Bacteroidales bacterium]|nr:SH3 domain-containing protein [Bacteroidales bacterium]